MIDIWISICIKSFKFKRIFSIVFRFDKIVQEKKAAAVDKPSSTKKTDGSDEVKEGQVEELMKVYDQAARY